MPLLTQDRDTAGDQMETYAGEAEIWRGWVQRGRRRTNSGARQRSAMAGIVLVLLALGSAFYLLAVR